MATEEKVPIEELHVTERPLWLDGPPYEVFKRLRSECPVHWTPRISEGSSRRIRRWSGCSMSASIPLQ